ncbi:ABC transporter ATP-binding protein [bacterium]|jgi:phospholipid/cholesterol/gamma-HCH transport system ATP-binding protein|nr:ABC transporter ATP-binding protein [bacterium]
MEPVIRLENVYKSFGDKHVLQGVSLEIYKGETFVILGPSGCGKSVTLKIITGLLEPDAGEVFVDGRDILRIKEPELNEIRRQMGMLFQNAALFDSLTVAENVGFGLNQMGTMDPEEIARRVSRNLELVGLSGIEEIMPSELSGGMRKRVGLARAIALHPRLIIYDEPTTGLDPIVATEIDQLVVKLQRELNATSVVITHDLNSAFRVADRMGLHFDGKIWEISDPDTFRNSKNPFVQRFLKGEPEIKDNHRIYEFKGRFV